jgi:hypothetical protein
MDINTPKGKKSLGYERDTVSLFCKLYPQYRFIETNKNTPAAIDGFFYLEDGGHIDYAVEIKTRNMTKEILQNRFDNTWLITHEKILRGQQVSDLLCIPFIGMLYLIPDKTIYTLKITDELGKFVIDFNVENTRTQETINGGLVWRTNAYLPMETAKEHKWQNTKQDAGCVNAS